MIFRNSFLGLSWFVHGFFPRCFPIFGVVFQLTVVNESLAFRIPSHGGCFPVELGGPFIEAISLAFAYTHHPTQQAVDVSRAVAILVLLMQIGQTIRLYVARKRTKTPGALANFGDRKEYFEGLVWTIWLEKCTAEDCTINFGRQKGHLPAEVVAQPSNGSPDLSSARESGERLFNQAASCESPVWLPSAFQTVSGLKDMKRWGLPKDPMFIFRVENKGHGFGPVKGGMHQGYLVAPPKTKSQLEKEQKSRDHEGLHEDPMVNVDMTPWFYVRTLLFVTAISWTVLLTGRIVECIMGERMLVTNPGIETNRLIYIYNQL